MERFLHDHVEHVLCVLLIVSRLGDMVSTYLVSPSLKLESNPIAKRFGWGFILLTSILACAIPYVSIQAAVVVLVVSLWTSAENVSRAWSVRAIGEEEYAAFLERAVRGSSLSQALLSVYAKAGFLVLMGVVLCAFSGGSRHDVPYWFGFGIVVHGFITAATSTTSLIARFNRAGSRPEEPRPAGGEAGGTGR